MNETRVFKCNEEFKKDFFFVLFDAECFFKGNESHVVLNICSP